MDIAAEYARGRNLNQIARDAGISSGTVRNRLLAAGVALRSRSQVDHFLGNRVELTDRLRQILDGEMLGDGCVTCTNDLSACYTHTTKHKAYLDWLSWKLARLGLARAGAITERATAPFRRDSGFYSDKTTYSYRFKTLSYRDLAGYRAHWYPGGTKVPPADLVLTPTVLLHWFLGDGSLQKMTTSRPRGTCEYVYSVVLLHSNGFPKEVNERLAMLLNELGLPFRVVRHRDSYQGRVNHTWQLRLDRPAENTPKFFDFVGACPPALLPVYGYKWDWERKTIPKPTKKLTDLG